MSMPNPARLIRSSVRALAAYVPGEQPKQKGLVKLNTNENPYPPSPKVLSAIASAVDGRLRLYPDPTASALRERLAKLHGCSSENIVVGNGSDEILALAVRAFSEPQAQGLEGAALSAARVQYFRPSYSLYPVLTDIHGAIRHPVDLAPDYSIPNSAELRAKGWDTRAALTLVTTPNAPSGRGYSVADLEALCVRQRGVVLLDEAYVDFAEDHAMELALRLPHVLVARSFSKAYSLCFQRVGYAVGNPELIGALGRLKDSYNVNGLGQVAGLATLSDLKYYRRNFQRVRSTRDHFAKELSEVGFQVLPSQTNFILCKPTGITAQQWQGELRRRGFLVRWFSDPSLSEYIRITVGTEDEMSRLSATIRVVLDL